MAWNKYTIQTLVNNGVIAIGADGKVDIATSLQRFQDNLQSITSSINDIMFAPDKAGDYGGSVASPPTGPIGATGTVEVAGPTGDAQAAEPSSGPTGEVGPTGDTGATGAAP